MSSFGSFFGLESSDNESCPSSLVLLAKASWRSLINRFVGIRNKLRAINPTWASVTYEIHLNFVAGKLAYTTVSLSILMIMSIGDEKSSLCGGRQENNKNFAMWLALRSAQKRNELIVTCA